MTPLALVVHNALVEAPCTRSVEAGQDLGPLAAGDVVCLTGARGPLVVRGVEGTPAAPIVLRGDATISVGSLEHGNAIWIADSAHIQVQGLRVETAQTGVAVTSSHHVRVEGLTLSDLGQAGISVSRARQDGRFTGPASHHVDLVGNRVHDTGKVTARYGEGVYVGTGGFEGDDTHHVVIARNTFSEVRAEAIDLKPHTHDLVVRENVVESGDHFFHAAITVGAQAFDGPDMAVLVEGNDVRSFTGADVAGIGVGHGNAIVRDNTVGEVEGGCSLRTWTTFANPEARSVRFEGNTIAGRICLDDGDQGTGLTDGLGDVVVR